LMLESVVLVICFI